MAKKKQPEPTEDKKPVVHKFEVIAEFTADKIYRVGSEFKSSNEKQINNLKINKLIR